MRPCVFCATRCRRLAHCEWVAHLLPWLRQTDWCPRREISDVTASYGHLRVVRTRCCECVFPPRDRASHFPKRHLCANEFLMQLTRPKLTAQINLKLDAQTWQARKMIICKWARCRALILNRIWIFNAMVIDKWNICRDKFLWHAHIMPHADPSVFISIILLTRRRLFKIFFCNNLTLYNLASNVLQIEINVWIMLSKWPLTDLLTEKLHFKFKFCPWCHCLITLDPWKRLNCVNFHQQLSE